MWNISLFEVGKVRGIWLQGLPNFRFLSISRVNNFFSTLDRALEFSKSKEFQKLYTKYSKWVFQNFQKIHNGDQKIETTPKIRILGHFERFVKIENVIISESFITTTWNFLCAKPSGHSLGMHKNKNPKNA